MVKRSDFRRRNSRICLEKLESRELLAGDLVGHWRAHELREVVADGALVEEWTDLSANIVADAVGQPTLVHNGINGRAVVRFSGEEDLDFFRVPAAQSPMSGADDFTIAVSFSTSSSALRGDTGDWFTNTGLVDGSRLGFSEDWGLSINSSGQLAAGIGEGFAKPISTIYSSMGGWNDGQFHTGTFVRQGSQLSLSVDGGEVTQANANALTRSSAIDFVIGAIANGSGGFEGDIAEVRVYNGALSSAEIVELQSEITTYYNNATPIAVDDSYSVPEDKLTVVGESILGNDHDDDGDSLTAVLVDDVQHGTLTLNPDGTFLYVSDRDYVGTDQFTYSAYDFRGSPPATVTINVTPQYDPIVTAPDRYKAIPTEILRVTAALGPLANDSNPDAVNRTVVVSQDVSNGRLTMSADGSFEYDPQGFAGITTFTYQVNDGTQLTSPETVTLVVNTQPTGQVDDYSSAEDTTLRVAVDQGVLANDQDLDGDSLTVLPVRLPEHGELTLAADGSFEYVPHLDFFGADGFTYVISDGTDDSAVTTVNLNILAVDDTPVGVADVYFGVKEEPINIQASVGVLANDTDVDSAQLTIQLVDPVTNGALQWDPDGAFRYTPEDGFVGTDQFSYRVSDGNSSSGPIEVSLFVGGSPLRISEFVAGNAAGITTRTRETSGDSFRGTATTPDWIEIENLSSSAFDLSGFHLTDDRNDRTLWAFPSETTIEASGYLVVYATQLDVTDPSLDENGRFHTNFALSLEEEYLAITSPDGAVIYEFAPYPDQVPDVSYGLTEGGQPAYLTASTPGAPNAPAYAGVVADTKFSVDRGFFDEPIQVEIDTQTEGAEIRYTFDGSLPGPNTGLLYEGPITIDRTTTLRAAAFLDDYLTPNIDTQTYLFVDQVIQQSSEPTTGPSGSEVAYPDRWRSWRSDYELDPEITQSDLYKDRMRDALLALPALSLTLDPEDIFGNNGLYSNPGSTSEEGTSAELIYPDGSVGFQIDAGARMQGGASRNVEHVKHSMSLRFREQYGDANLDFPLFPDSPVTSFNSLHLRARYNNSWIHWDQGQRNRGSMIREAWMRDSMLAAGDIAAGHGDYVHLYLNGLYWGVYEMHERQDASHYANYFGGEDFQYDAYNATALVDGTRDAFTELRSIVRDKDWDRIQEVLDVDNHILFTIIQLFGGNQDLKSDGNWRIAGGGPDRAPWQFYMWDVERVLENVRQRSTSPVVDANLLGFLRDLDDIPEYLMRFADHVHRVLFNDGALTEAQTADRWMARADQLDLAIVAESARWGDLKQANRPLTRDQEWVTERDRLMEDYFPERTQNVIDNLRRANLYPDTDAPEFTVDGMRQHGGLIEIGDSVGLENPNVDQVGQVFFTMDGSDPRLEGGAVSPLALEYLGNAVSLASTTTIKARILNNGEWSALTEARFSFEQPATADNIAITEVNYHPQNGLTDLGEPDLTDSEFEFIEVANISSVSVDLSGVMFREVGDGEGIKFTFAPQILGPGERLVVVGNREAFEARYGDSIAIALGRDGVGGNEGEWGGGRLSNGGETLTLYDASGEIIRQFTYDDEGSWPERADGVGSTLTLVDPTAPADDARNWIASDRIGGTPGSEDVARTPDVLINEILTNSDAPDIDRVELINTLNVPVDISRWYLSDAAGQLTKFQFAVDTTPITPGGYLVVDENELGFGFKGQENDDVWLVTADQVGRPQFFADSFEFLATRPGVSLGRWPNGQGDLFPQVSTSFGSQNVGPDLGGAILSEVMYNPAVPDGGALTARDLEYVEVWNTLPTPLDLGAWRLGKAVDFTFADGTTVAPSSGVLVVSFDPENDAGMAGSFRQNYGITDQVRLVGPYEGVLDNGGEKLELQRPVANDDSEVILVDRVRYDDDPPWPILPDGSGQSLHRVSPDAYGDLVASWTGANPTPGQASFGPPPGDLNGDGVVNVDDVDFLIAGIRASDPQSDLNSDGSVDSKDLTYFVVNTLGTTIGDANLDGVFDSGDLVEVFRSGEYEDETSGNSTWAEGDWNADGEFTTGDLVAAFTEGGYVANAMVAGERASVAAAMADEGPGGGPLNGVLAEPVQRSAPYPVRPVTLELVARDLIFAEMSNDRPTDDGADDGQLDLGL